MNRRVVVKIGSQVLCDEQGRLARDVLAPLVSQVAALQENGWEVLLVSSGAVAAGKAVADGRLLSISDPVARQQVMAATGQVRLMETYQGLFARHGLAVAQVLASKADFQTRRHYLNMRGCIEALLGAGVVPIVNENDVVAITELMFTDNDELAGLLATMVAADRLVLLSTVPGVFDGDPDDNHVVDEIVQLGTSALGRGGMHSKLSVALKTARLGTEVIIADGRQAGILENLANDDGAGGTRFPAGPRASPAKRWLASTGVQADAPDSARVTVNEGAAAALLDRSRLTSLLPVGIEHLSGAFDRGDIIQIRDPSGRILGCGQARYSREQAENLVGKRGQKPLIHYDYLYLLD
jgi:glutamate 5-kinase